MIDKNDDIQQRNIDLLIAGYWYEDLPPVHHRQQLCYKQMYNNISNWESASLSTHHSS